MSPRVKWHISFWDTALFIYKPTDWQTGAISMTTMPVPWALYLSVPRLQAPPIRVSCHANHPPADMLFPSWQGQFDDFGPSFVSLPNEHAIQTLKDGLLTVDRDGAQHSIRSCTSSPHSNRISWKPKLPFHALISALVDFLADMNSRVFWLGALIL